MSNTKLSITIRLMLLSWQKRATKKQFLFILAIVIGISAGLAAVLLKTAVHHIFELAMHYKIADSYYTLLLLPALGITLTYFVIRRFLGGELTKGLASLHYAIAKKSSFLPRKQMYSQMVTSPITVGLGGSAGLEAPIVVTGAALGSNYARYFRLGYAERTLLLACGVAAGIASAFNAPIAGVLFTLEVLMLDIGTTGFIPLLIAAATGALVSKIILEEGAILSFQLVQPFDYNNVPFYVALGVLAGFMSVLHARVFVRVERHFSQFAHRPALRILYAGAFLALLVLMFPTLFGEGYSSIKSLSVLRPEDLFSNSIFNNFIVNEWLVLAFVAMVMLLKSVATGITLGGGGNGGNFAPTLFVGSYLGYVYSKLINQLNLATIPETNFTIVGMAGLLSGLYHAPLTAIFLIAELTGGYTLMIPLMLVSSLSYLVSKSIEPYTMDTKKLAEERKILSDDKDANILVAMQMDNLIETNFAVLKESDSLQPLIQAIISSERNIFPVVDDKNKLLGIILLNDVKNIIFNKERYPQLRVKDLMKPYLDVINSTDDMTTVVEKFETTEAWNLPVIDENGYVGFISKSKLFSSYRDELINRTIS